MTATNDRPMMVIGAPRSGTTLLQLMLHAHPRIAIPPENKFVIPAYQKRREFGDLRKEGNRRALARWIVNNKRGKFADFGLDSDEVIEEIVASAPTVGSALATVFRCYAKKFDKPRWGDKRPKYATSIDLVRRLFPTAQFVSIVRDGRDCVASLKEQDWYRPDTYFAASTWALSVDHARRAAKRLGPDSFYELHYERLVADPERELRALCEYLGEEFDPAMTEPASVAEVIPERKSHHFRTREPVTGARIGAWEGRLEPWEVSLCEGMLGDRLRSRGYKLSGAAAPTVGARLRYTQVVLRRRANVPVSVVRAFDRIRGQGAVAAQPLPESAASNPGGSVPVEPSAAATQPPASGDDVGSPPSPAG